MKITHGKMLEAYAQRIGGTIEEVLEWANCYVNTPEGNFPIYEDTPKERFESIRAFVERELKEAA